MYDTFASPRIKDKLIAAIREHCAASPDRTAYVVPRSELHGQSEHANERFIVVALPDMSAREIDHRAQQIRVEVRARPDGTSVECVSLASGAVAVSGQVVQAVGAGGPLLVAWLFRDETHFSEYLLSGEDMDDLQAAQQVAQSRSMYELCEVKDQVDANEQVIEVFEHVVVAIEPSPA
jgi:hypothetical protein